MDHQMPNGGTHHTNGPIQPLFPDLTGYPPQNKTIRATGTLSWLSSKAGVIQCASMNSTVSFQLKDFCDQGVTDFISVLRPGFRLAFQAVANDGSNEWIGNYVAPLHDSEPLDDKEINLEEFEKQLTSDVRHASKDQYSLQLEIHALSFLLSVFQKNGTHNISLSSLHSRISNSGLEDLYRYIGSSSLKRRQFIERRSYIFHITENDVVYLQPAEVYTTVLMLSSFLLRRGGATSSDSLFSFFNNSPQIPAIVKETVQNSRVKFMELLSAHPFAFSPFPSQFYVSVRRNLPFFDYARFIKKNFPNCSYPIRLNGTLQYAQNGGNNFASFDQAASSDQMSMAQYAMNGGQMNYPNMFQEDTPVVTPRNPWTALETPPTPMMPPTQQQPSARPAVLQPPPQTPFQNATMDPNLFLNGVGGAASNVPAPLKMPPPQSLVAAAPPAPQKPAAHPGVIGDRAMTRHNSVSSASLGSNSYDMMMMSGMRGGFPTISPYSTILNTPGTDPRFSCSPPLSASSSSAHQSKASNGSGGSRPGTVDSATQTEDYSSLDFSRLIGSQPNCRCVCTCNMESLIRIFNGPSLE